MTTHVGGKRIPYPPEAGNIVSMVEFNGRVFVACQHRVYELVNDELRPLMFVHQPLTPVVFEKEKPGQADAFRIARDSFKAI